MGSHIALQLRGAVNKHGLFGTIAKVFRLLWSRTRTLLESLLIFLAAIFLRCVRSLVPFRLGLLDASRIGHMIIIADTYMSRASFEPSVKRKDLFVLRRPISNREVLKLVRTRLCVIPFGDTFWKAAERHLTVVRIPSLTTRNRYADRVTAPPQFCLSEEQVTRGHKLLDQLRPGWTEKPLVGLLVRDRGYLDQQFPGRDWSYQTFRDAEVATYAPAVWELIARGYTVIRLGVGVTSPLEVDSPDFLDCAWNGSRTELLDLLVCFACTFFFTTGTGLDEAAVMFRRPQIYSNYLPIYNESIRTIWNPGSLFLFKRLWWRSEQRLLTMSEMRSTGAWSFLRTEQFDEAGIDVLDNTPEELLAAGVEMDERVRGVWQDQPGDQELRERFWSFLDDGKEDVQRRGIICAQFLRDNEQILV